MSLFKREVRITAGQVRALTGAKLDSDSEALPINGGSVLEWKLCQVADALGFTDMIAFRTVAESLGAQVTQDATGLWVDNKSPAGVPKQLAMRLAAMLNLQDQVLRMYTNTFQQLESTGSKLKDAQKAALQSVDAYMKVQLNIINKKYPESYTAYVGKNLSGKLQKDYSGLDF